MEFRPLGDCAVTVTVGSRIDEPTRARILSLCAALDSRGVPGMTEFVPAFASLTVHYDPARVPPGPTDATPYARFSTALRHVLQGAADGPSDPPRVVEIGVVYGGEYGPDIEDVARRAGLPVEQVIRLHTGAEYVVHMVGFIAGFGYLGGLPSQLATPRRATPRTRVPASSVGIGGSQTGVYPVDSPGGWNLIGRTPLRMFDPAREPATLLRTGDRVRFISITPDELDRAGSPA